MTGWLCASQVGLWSRTTLALLLVLSALSLNAETTPPSETKATATPHKQLPYLLHLNRDLVVGICESPPFVFRNAKGEWTGVTIDLWEAIAKRINAKYTYQPMELGEMITAVTDGKIDVGATALTINVDRARAMDLTHTYYGSGLGIATTLADRTDLWADFFSRIFTWNFLQAFLALTAILLATGFLIWLFERKHNPDQFGSKPFKGLSDGFWWSAVTMTTVGYGDKSPVTPMGRIIGLIWMFTSIIVISGFTGAIATALTLGQLQPKVTGLSDLAKAKVGVLDDSVGDHFLRSMNIYPKKFPSVEAGLKALSDDKLDAFVHDKPILSYFVAKHYATKLNLLPHTFDPGFYSLALPNNSPLMDDVDMALLEYMQSPAWNAVLLKYGLNR